MSLVDFGEDVSRTSNLSGGNAWSWAIRLLWQRNCTKNSWQSRHRVERRHVPDIKALHSPKDECRNILFAWLSFCSTNDDVLFPDFVQLVQQWRVYYIEVRKLILNSCYLKICTFRRGNDLCFRVDCYQTSLGSWWFWVMSQKSSRQRKQAETRLIIHACHATNMCLTNHLFPEEKNPKQTRSSLRPTKKQKHCAFKGHLSKPVPSQSTKMAPFHSHSRGKAMVQVARTVAIEAHILELGRAVSAGERQRYQFHWWNQMCRLSPTAAKPLKYIAHEGGFGSLPLSFLLPSWSFFPQAYQIQLVWQGGVEPLTSRHRHWFA